MVDKIDTPHDYVPFQELVLCSNKMVGVHVPFLVDGGVPLLVGNDGGPKVWLNAKPPGTAGHWLPVVRRNKSVHGSVKVATEGAQKVVVTAGTVVVLVVEAMQGTGAEVSQLDLRPLGLNLYGDTSGLTVGTNRIVGNEIHDAQAMVKIGQ